MSRNTRETKRALRGGKRHWAVRALGWLLALVLFGVVAAVAAFFIAYASISVPDANKDFATENTIVYYSDGKHVLGEFADQNRTPVAYADIPQSMQNAVVAAEDRTFWTNAGISPSGIVRAAFAIARGGDLQGGSTITQQYVKVAYLTQERTFTRKFKELFISMKVNKLKGKQQVMAGYLNTIYFGRGAYGVQAADKAWFGSSNTKTLTVQQSAFLAAILNSPGRLDPDNGPSAKAALLERYRYVLDGMRQAGTITATQAAAAQKALPATVADVHKNKYAGSQGFLLSMARTSLEANGISDAEIDGGGLRVTTTFDYNRQQEMVAAAEKTHPDKTAGLHIGMASVAPRTGALVAMYGGPDFLKSQINWAASRARPGSSFKPFAIAAALGDKDLSLDTRLQGNSPITINGQELGNEFGEDYGSRVSLLKATEESINTAFYDLVANRMTDGPAQVAKTANALGIDHIPASDTKAPAIVLGPNAYASPIDMAGAYGGFANGGEHNPTYVIQLVKSVKGGDPVYEHKAEPTRAVSADIANEVNYALGKVVTSGTGTKAEALDRPVAGKTGTAGVKDDTLTSWWVGYTPQLSTAVLYRAGTQGESDLDPYSSDKAFFGGNWPVRTWLAYMEPALKGQPVLEFGKRGRDNSDTSGDNGNSDAPTRSQQPSSQAPVSEAPTQPTTAPTQSTTQPPTTQPPTQAPTTEPPTTQPPTTRPPTTQPPTTPPPTTAPPTTRPPTTQPPTQPTRTRSSSPPPTTATRESTRAPARQATSTATG